jgi:hypothetical protein
MDTKELAQNTLKALNELLTMEVVTTLGDVEIGFKDNSKEIELKKLDSTACAITRINIASGDIWSNKALSGPDGEGAKLAEYHAQMVEKSQAIVERNVRLIVEMIEKLRTAL